MHRRPFSLLFVLVSLPASVLVIALGLPSAMAQSQTYIFGRTDLSVGTFPSAVAAGDFNGDGLTDLVVANMGDTTVSVLLKRSDGSFAPQVTYPTGPQPIAIATGDFNGDGNLDIAVSSENCTQTKYLILQCTPSTVSILLGNGDGTFQPHMDFPVGELPQSLLVADFNGDGKLDLAVANAFDSTVSILLGRGDGTFQSQVVYSTASSGNWGTAFAGDVVAGDFNGDGKLDLAVSCASVVSVLLGNGDGSFQAHLDSGVGGFSLAVGDFNRDGSLDLAVTGGVGTPSLNILTGKGDGTFILTQQYPPGMTVTTTDLRGNGMVDLVITGSGSYASSVGILLGNGDGTFQPVVNYGTAGGAFAGALAAVATDLNGDGKLDLAVVNSCFTTTGTCTGTVSVLLGFGDGTFVGTNDMGLSGSVTSADFNNDGKLDCASAFGSLVSVLLGNGDGTFQPQLSYSTVNSNYLVTADLRNNGIVDLVAANYSANTVSVLLGNGDGTFQTHVDYAAGLEPLGIAVGDFRGNGKLDLAIADFTSASVAILLGNGDGTFQAPVGYITAANPGGVATGDFNQDGKLDLAVADYPGLSILLGNGDGTFAGHVDYPGTGASAIAVADFNGDGKLDVVIGGQSSLSVLLGNGDGTFQLPINYPFGAFSIAVTDFNQDGKLDLGLPGVILLGNGDGTFQPPIQYPLDQPYSQTVGDFNGDGVPDWVIGDTNSTGYLGIMLSAAFKSVAPGALNFGSQGVGTTSGAQTITISNPSNVKIKISSIAAAGNFGQTNNCGAELSLGANCTVTVTFSPSTTGTQSGSIIVTDNTRISPLAIPITGTGVNGPFSLLIRAAYPSQPSPWAHQVLRRLSLSLTLEMRR